MQSCYSRIEVFWLLPKVTHFPLSKGSHIKCGWGPYPLWQADYILGEWVLPPYSWHFFSCETAVPVWLGESTQTTVALESNLCHIFGFLDHFQSTGDVPVITKANRQWADSQG